MKKITLIASIIALGARAAVAQTNSSSSADAALDVVVADVQSISVSSVAPKDIPLDNKNRFTATAHSTGMNNNALSTLDVESSGAFRINVSHTDDADASHNTASCAPSVTNIPVYLSVSNPRQNTPGSAAPSATYEVEGQDIINTAISLIATPTDGPKATAGTLGTKYDINYKLARITHVSSLAPKTFAGTVIYTITDL